MPGCLGGMTVRVVYYVNQFFGGIGGEEQADAALQVRPGAVGPAQALKRVAGANIEVVATVVAGDNWVNGELGPRIDAVANTIAAYSPDVVLAGPAFGAGRYGVAVGALAAELGRRGQVVVGAMDRNNPAVVIYRRQAYLIDSGTSPKSMTDIVAKMWKLAQALFQGSDVGDAQTFGYIARGYRVPVRHEKSGAERAVDLLMKKLAGQPFVSEIPLREAESFVQSPALTDLGHATIVLVTDGGIVPCGNPDHIEGSMATKIMRYSLAMAECLDVNHGGYDVRFARENPYRVLPLDSLFRLKDQGFIGQVHPFWFTTAGNATPGDRAKQFAQVVISELKTIAGPVGVLLTST